MNPGRLRHRITIQKSEIVQDEIGNNIQVWTDWATVWANIRPIGGKEYYQAAMINAENDVRVNIRYRPGIDPLKMRVKYGERIFDIKAAIDINERRQEIEMICKEKVISDG